MRCKQPFGRAGGQSEHEFSPFTMDPMDDRLYFPVNNIKFDDLHDWSIKSERHRVSVGSVTQPTAPADNKPLNRQKSKTGSLAEINETKVALFRYESEVYAINEKCPHAGGPLHIGDIEELPDRDLCVRCPWHSWRFSLKTGKVVHPTSQDRHAIIYPVRIRPDGTILIGFKAFSPAYFQEFQDI